MPGFWTRLTGGPSTSPVIPYVPALTAARATDLYGTPDGDPRGEWARANIVYCGGGGHPSCLPTMPGVPPHLWFAVHRRAEPKMRAAFTAAQKAATAYAIGSAGGWVYRHQRHDERRPLSNHSWGAAVDVDARHNGLVEFPIDKGPAPWSAAWLKRWPKGLPQAWVEAFVGVGGIGWGGAWRGTKDPMHFEVYDPEG
jgi:hypothetical protein